MGKGLEPIIIRLFFGIGKLLDRVTRWLKTIWDYVITEVMG